MTTRLLADLLRAARARGYITVPEHASPETERYIDGIRWGVSVGDRQADGTLAVYAPWYGPDQYAEALKKLAQRRATYQALEVNLVYSIEADPEYWHIVPRDEEEAYP